MNIENLINNYPYIFLILGFIVLLYSGNYLVKGGSALAKKVNIPPLIIGLTIISFGTSAPELLVSVNAVNNGHLGISIGNVIGSNIANIGLVLGLTALLMPLPLKKKTILFDWFAMMLSAILFYIFIKFSNNNYFNQIHALIFLILIILYIVSSVLINKKNYIAEKNTEKQITLMLSVFYIAISIVGLKYGAEFLVESSSNIAKSFGVSEYVISVTIIAFGTSVPELATSIIAVFKKETDISIGNIIGSNIFNFFAILGVTGTIKPIKVDGEIINNDIFWVFGFYTLLLLFIMPLKRSKITRFKGLIFLIFYILYIMLILKNK